MYLPSYDSFSFLKKEKSLSFKKFYEDEQKFLKGYELCYDSLSYEKAIKLLDNITSINRRGFAYHTIAQCYRNMGNNNQAERYLIEALKNGFDYNDEEDTAILKKSEVEKYYASLVDESLIKKISILFEKDQMYRRQIKNDMLAEDKEKLIRLQMKADDNNLNYFNKLVSEYGWPILEKTGNDIKMMGFLALIDHFPSKYQRIYLDSCIYYAKQNRDDWTRAMTLINDLITDERSLFVPSLFVKIAEKRITDLEYLEIVSIYENSLKYSDSNWHLAIKYRNTKENKSKALLVVKTFKKIGYIGKIKLISTNEKIANGSIISYKLSYE